MRPRQITHALIGRPDRGQDDHPVDDDVAGQAVHGGDAEGARRASASRTPAGDADLVADSQIPGQQAQPNGDPIGVQAGADQVVEVVAAIRRVLTAARTGQPLAVP